MKKTDLELALDDYLSQNAEQLSADTRLQGFYKRRLESSPIKKEMSGTAEPETGLVKRVKRRATKAADEFSTALTSATYDSHAPQSHRPY